MANVVEGEGDLYWQTPDGNIVYLGKANLKDAEPEFNIPDEWRNGKTFSMKVKFEDEESMVDIHEILTDYYDDVRRQWLRMKFPLFVWN